MDTSFSLYVQDASKSFFGYERYDSQIMSINSYTVFFPISLQRGNHPMFVITNDVRLSACLPAFDLTRSILTEEDGIRPITTIHLQASP